MNTFRPIRFAAVALGAVAFCLSSLSTSPALAVPVRVDFSGGNGSPLTVSIPEPITFNVTDDLGVNETTLIFVIKDTGNFFVGSGGGATGNLGFTHNSFNGPTLNVMGQLPQAGLSNLFIYASNYAPDPKIGDVVVLGPTPGIVTGEVTALPPPPSGLYEMTLIDAATRQIAVGVPEPAALAPLALAAATFIARRRTRRGR